MKKYVPYIIIAVLVLGGIGVYAALQAKSGGNDTQASGSDDSKSVARKYSDACGIFTKDQIAAALGGSYADGEGTSTPSTATPGSDDYEALKGSECSFDQDNDGTTTGMTEALNLTVAVNNFKDTAAAKTFMSDLHDPQTAEGKASVKAPVDVDGVGDQAFFSKLNTATGVEDKTEALYVLVGKQVVVLTATSLAGVDHDTVQANLTKLAKEL